MKKIIVLVLYICFSIGIIISSFVPSGTSKKQSEQVGSTIGSFFNRFIDDKIIMAEDITVGDYNEKHYIYESINLSASVLPASATYSSLTYSSSDNEIATVDEIGNVKFIKEGTVTIEIEQKESKIEKAISFIVSKILPERITINAELTMKKGTSQLINSTILPSNITSNVTYSTSDSSIISIKNGVLFALDIGKANLTARVDDKIESVEITVIGNDSIVKMTSISIEGEYSIAVNEQKKLTAAIAPSTASQKFVFWQSMNEDVLSVDNNGNVFCHKAGKAVIKATDYEGETVDTFEIECHNILPVFSFETLDLRVGKSGRIVADNIVTYGKCSYSISDESIASVYDDGTVVAKKVGNATITIVCNDGFDSTTKTIELKVEKQVIYDKVNNFNYIVRKIVGHFMYFALLGVLGFLTYYLWLKKKLAIIICFTSGLLLAIITEVIQLFIGGRAGSFVDVLIDYGGYLLGVGMCVLTLLLINKRKNRAH